MIQPIWTRLQKERIYLPLHTQIQSYAMAQRFDIPVNASGPVFFKEFRIQR